MPHDGEEVHAQLALRPFAVRDGMVYAYRNHTAKHQPDGDYAGGTDVMAVDATTGWRLWSVKTAQDDRTGVYRY
ncbi:hypothetical protein ACFW1F_18365 [Streptomyces bungoensis]|uniref:hypothetical protein n=1 Tax=Streptomyces bungoensis TaxID=285568 RepID=UPI00368B46F2